MPAGPDGAQRARHLVFVSDVADDELDSV